MRKKIYYLSVLLLFFQCKSAPVFKATDANNGSSFDIKQGELFTVSLKAQLSTGYSWNSDLPDESIIVQEKSETISLEKDEGVKTGGFELQQFTFKGIKKGSTELSIKYCKPWVKKDPIKVYKININIK